MVVLLSRGQMIGMFTKAYLLFLLFIICACSKQAPRYKEFQNTFDKRYDLSLGQNESRNYFATLQEIENDPIKREKLSYYLDLDGDGIVDFHDQDIDGDSFHNYVDSHPMDSEIGGEDLNVNGLIDFIENDKYQNLQLNLLESTKVFLIVPNQVELSQEVISLLENEIFLNLLSGVETVFFNPIERTRNADYNIQWKSINIYPQGLANRAYESLIHEGFHHIAQKNPSLFDQIIAEIGWREQVDEYGFKKFVLDENVILPSSYAYHDEVESFAEIMMFFYVEKYSINTLRFTRADEFRANHLYQNLGEQISALPF